MQTPIENRFDSTHAAKLPPEQQLLYRSNLLGADLRITNFGGGNTSAKIMMPDPLTGANVQVLWVKGSGGDLGSMNLSGFATLYLDKLHSLKQRFRSPAQEDEMPGLLPHCIYNNNPRAASIDTPLHAFLPFNHIDHLHPDDVIAVAASRTGEKWAREIFGEEIGWIPWLRPGFELALRIAEKVTKNPHLRGLVLGGHGLMTWGATSKECYENSIAVINKARSALATKSKGSSPLGEITIPAMAENKRRELLAENLPFLRGKVGARERKIVHIDDSAEVLEFIGSARARELSAIGTSCPDHFLRTKIWPLFLEIGAGELRSGIDGQLSQYREHYSAYYERCKQSDSPAMRDPSPVVVLWPGIGMLTFGGDKPTARRASEFFINAIHVMRGASALDGYVGLPEREAFGIEYWPLEEAKLKRLPPKKPCSRRIAFLTGGAGGIGRATARRLLLEGACVVICDIDGERLSATEKELAKEFGDDFVRSVICDVTKEESVASALRKAAIEYGGIDMLVCSAGLASAASVEETTVELWQKNMDVLARGYFLTAREAFKIMKEQQSGGSIVFVTSKNALAASPNASAYCAAKAAALHLARCLALEGAPHGIRVNCVNPDAVLRGSKIWSGNWRTERADAYHINENELEEYYRKRSLLGASVYPEDVAEAIYYFASDASAKSTGNILNVDAGNAAAFTR